MISGNFYHNFLGWDYSTWFSAGAVVLWFVILFYFKKGRKEASNKRKIFTRIISVLLVLHLVFVAFINPYFFGLGSPIKIEKIYFTEQHLCLFDTKEDLYLPSDEYEASEIHIHSRIHVIDKAKGTLLYSESLGTDYTYAQIQGEIVLIENSNSPKEDYYYLKSIALFDIETKERIVIAEQSGIVNVQGREIKVFEIIISDRILIKNKEAEVFEYNFEIKAFEQVTSLDSDVSITEPIDFRLVNDEVSSEMTNLTFQHKALDQRFIHFKFKTEFEIENLKYCLVQAYSDLTKVQEEISIISETGELKWKKSVQDFEETIDGSLSEFDLLVIDKNSCYVASGSYIFECKALTGQVNWWIKL